jgi:CRISPR-associated endonuclease/helicase Cas3
LSHLTPETQSLTLVGLDGGNPLAFLAALGTFRTLSLACPEEAIAISWALQRGVWTPSVHAGKAMTQQYLIDTLVQTLQTDAAKHPIAFMNDGVQGGDKETTKKAKHGKQRPANGASGDAEPADQANSDPGTAQLFADRAEEAVPANRDALCWLSAMASDLAPNATSQLQTARRDYFWGNLKSVIAHSNAGHLRRTLFEPWDYADPLENQSLHIEPSEDRRHAHQWSKPSGDPDRKKRGGMLGANRLAIEAFSFFQSLPAKDKLATRGFFGLRTDDTRWTWPLWSRPINADVVSSLLSLAELQTERPDHRNLSARGVSAVFRCRRILVGKTPNFTPAMAV